MIKAINSKEAASQGDKYAKLMNNTQYITRTYQNNGSKASKLVKKA